MTPIQPRALKVESGHVTQVQEEGLSQRPTYVADDSLSAPDGTYLRLDYVVEVLDGMRAQVKQAVEAPRDAERVLASLTTFFQSRAL